MSRLARFVPLRLAGLAVLAASGGALAFGRARLDFVLTVAGMWGLAVVALTGLAALVAFLHARRALRRAAREATAPLAGVEGVAAPTGLALAYLPWPLATRPALAWLAPAARIAPRRGGDHGAERYTPLSRTLADEIARELVVEDALGLWRFSARARQRRRVRVLPHPGRIAGAELAAALAAGDLIPHPFGPPRGDLVDFRPYTRSDPARLIVWKIYARTRKLVARTAEPARAPTGRPLVYLCAGPADEAAAAAAIALIESGTLGEGALFAADGAPRPVTALEDVRDAAAGSSAHRAHTAQDLAAALADPGLADDDPVIVICPALAPGPSRDALRRRLAAAPRRFTVVVAADAVPRRAPRPAWQRLLLREAAPAPCDPRATAAVFAAAGVRSLAVDRRTGRVFAAQDAAHEMPA